MDTSEYVGAVVEQMSILADWVQGQDPVRPVPTCPRWTLAGLVDHVGATLTWAGATSPGADTSGGR